MFANLVWAEDYKLLRRRMLWIMIALVVLLTVGELVVQYVRYANAADANNGLLNPKSYAMVRQQTEQAITWPSAPVVALGNTSDLGWLLLVVLVGAATAQEYTWHTLHLWLGRGVPRLTVVVAKTVAFVLPALLIVLIPLAASLLVSLVLTLVRTGGVDLSQTHFGYLALSALLAAYATLPYAAFAFLLAVATRTQVAPLAGGFVFWLASLGLFNTGSPIGTFTPIALGAALQPVYAAVARSPGAGPFDLASAFGMRFSGLLSPAAAILAIAAWVVVCVGVAAVIFHRQDLAD